MKPHTILSIDDNEDDNFLLRRAFRKGAESVDLRVVNDGEAAIDYLAKIDGRGDEATDFPEPDLILLDLKMPRKDGFAVLDWLNKRESGASSFRVAIFTSSQSSNDIDRAYRKGAEWYLVKPIALEDLVGFAADVVKWVRTGENALLTESPYYRARTEG